MELEELEVNQIQRACTLTIFELKGWFKKGTVLTKEEFERFLNDNIECVLLKNIKSI